MYASDFTEKGFLNIFTGQTFTAPTTLYVGLFLTSPTGSGTGGVEVSYPNYARKEITFNPPVLEGLDVGIRNSTNINFAESNANAGTIKHIGIYDAATGGNLLLYGDLMEDLQIMAGEEPGLATDEVFYFVTGDMSNAYKTKLLNVMRGQNMQGIIPHLALFNNDPENNGSELAGVGYERVKLEFSAPTPEASGLQIIRNSNATSFNRPNVAWGTWNYTVVYDAKTGGSPVYKKPTPSKNITRGVQPIVPINSITLGLN